MISEKEAWQQLHRSERAAKEFKKRLKEIELEIERLRLDMEESYVRQCTDDEAFLRVLRRFTGHTPHGWEMACGCDGRCKALVRQLGWPALWRVILRVRHIRNIW
jgi:hypothetical protein